MQPDLSSPVLLTRSTRDTGLLTNNTSGTSIPSFLMAGISTSDLVVIVLTIVLASVYLFKDTLFAKSNDASASFTGKVANGSNGHANGGADANYDTRDVVAKLKATKKRIAIFYGSQTGTAEDYAIRLAKEAKSKFGLSSLVCDAEEYDYESISDLPSDCCLIFVMATYGEGEPTDNAVTLVTNLKDEDFMFNNGSHDLSAVKYVVFGLGNRTYEHYNVIAKQVDEALTKAGAQRIGERGEGDDDKSMEEDYLAWKDGMWEEFSKVMGVEEGAGADTADFVVSELTTVDKAKVYLGELSARALNKTKGIHDQKNPYPAPILSTHELFTNTDPSNVRNCVHIEFDITGSGITYQHGDHVGVWPSNPSFEVTRLLHALGLYEKRDTVIGIESLDPALAKVPFPVPSTYESILRYYLDVKSVVGRQALNAFSKYAPEGKPEMGERLKVLGTDKEAYSTYVSKPCLTLGEVLMLAAGDEPILLGPSSTASSTEHTLDIDGKVTAWPIPFDVLISAVPRLQPRFYSISSSPKLHPTAIHVTCVVLKHENLPASSSLIEGGEKQGEKYVYGVGSNYLLNLMSAKTGERMDKSSPRYDLSGPRGTYHPTPSVEEGQGQVQGAEMPLFKAPVHVRRSTFRLPTNPKSPVLMIGPGTGVAPFRGFVQERVALARKALEKNGDTALDNWGQMQLYYGCRSSTSDYLYSSEWPQYTSELKGKFNMRVAFSREGARKPDGSKIYVQDLLWEDKDMIKEMIWDKKGYVYICGDAKAMSKAVEDVLARILSEAKGSAEDISVGQQELKSMKERSRILLDVWS